MVDDVRTSWEVRVAFLEHRLLELDDVVQQLASNVARLERELAAVRDEMPALMEGSAAHERPPHHLPVPIR
jgi:uncharacterized coiled-coil protein SlyX